MKLLRIAGEQFQLEFAPKEKELLFHLLGLYPVVPASHHRLTTKKKIPHQKENQQLLDEALQSHRQANQREVIALLNQFGRFADDGKVCRAAFTRGELEWLLQVLNDVRIGSWIALGSPGTQPARHFRRDEPSARLLMQMELAGAFELFLLGVIHGDVTPEPAGA